MLCCDFYMHFVWLIVFCRFHLFERLEEFLSIEVENIPEHPARNMRATPACLFTYVCIAHMLQIPHVLIMRKNF